MIKHPEPTHWFVSSQGSLGSSSTRVLTLETGLLSLIATLRSLTKGLGQCLLLRVSNELYIERVFYKFFILVIRSIVKSLFYLSLIYILCFEQPLFLFVYLYTNTNQFCSALLSLILQSLPSFILYFCLSFFSFHFSLFFLNFYV
jgi:hypothetical protein